MAWEDIADLLTVKGKKKLKTGQVLVFDYEGSRNEYKIMRMYKGKVWVKPTTLYKLSELKIVDAVRK